MLDGLSSANQSLPLVLLPGMGADERMFRAQAAAFPQLRVATWIRPERGESLPHYAERMVDHWKPSPAGFLGGASLGGAVALEMASLIQPRTCFLLGSLRSPDELRPVYHRWRSFTPVTGGLPPLAFVLRWTIGLALGRVSRGALRQLSRTEGQFLQWATRALLDWTPSAETTRVTVLQIHGERDWIIPARRSRADQFVPRAGHLVSISHANDVNAYLQQGMLKYGSH